MNLTLDAAELEKLADMLAERVATRLADTQPIAPAAGNRAFWNEAEAAEFLGISVYTLKRARLAGSVAAATNTRPILYDKEHLDRAAEWVRSR